MPTRGARARRPARRAAASPPSPLQEKKREAVRQEIARVAWRLFDAGGYEATTVDDVAHEAGVSRRTFFRYYSSKEDVLVETSDALVEDFLAAFGRRPRGEPPLVSIRHAMRAVVGARLRDTEQARAIIRLLRESRTLRRAMLERHALMGDRLTAMIAERTGKDPRKDPTPALLALVARVLLGTSFNFWFDRRPKDVGKMVDDLFERLRSVVAA